MTLIGGASISALTRGTDYTDYTEEDEDEVVKREREEDEEDDDDDDGDGGGDGDGSILWQRRVDPLPSGSGRPVESVAAAAGAAAAAAEGGGGGDGGGEGGLLTTLLGASPLDAEGKPKRRPRYIHTKWLQTSERWLDAFEDAAASASTAGGCPCIFLPFFFFSSFAFHSP